MMRCLLATKMSPGPAAQQSPGAASGKETSIFRRLERAGLC